MIVVGWRPDIKLKILPLSDVWKETPDSKCLCALLLYEKLLAQGSLPDFGGAGAFPVRYARCLFGVPYMEGGWLYPPLPVSAEYVLLYRMPFVWTTVCGVSLGEAFYGSRCRQV